MTLNIGANHVADNMGPSVGSKAPITANRFDRVELCHRVFGDAECSWAAVQFLIPATTDFNAAIT